MHATVPGLRTFADSAALAATLAGDVVDRLQRALDAGREASLLVPGGRTPAQLFDRLATVPLRWARVHVGLTDERRVPRDDPASNERLVRERLLVGAAAAARFTGLADDAQDPDVAAAHAFAALAPLPRPFDAVVLGMGDDGHFASLFPGGDGLATALDPAAAPGCVAMRAPAAPHERLSLNLAALLASRFVALAVTGAAKRRVLDAAATPGPPTDLPVRALLAARQVPVTVYWAPE
jgi:6-phosphogluconolactonase